MILLAKSVENGGEHIYGPIFLRLFLGGTGPGEGGKSTCDNDTKAHVYKPLGDRDPLLLAYFILAPRAWRESLESEASKRHKVEK